MEEYNLAQTVTVACSMQTELVATVHTLTYILRHTIQFPLRFEIAGAEVEYLNLSPQTHIPNLSPQTHIPNFSSSQTLSCKTCSMTLHQSTRTDDDRLISGKFW
jgi:hypothetical protein